MVTITLPPELEQAITERAKTEGTTPEILALDKLCQFFLPVTMAEITPAPLSEGETMLDFFAGYAGVLHSSEFVPGGAQMSQDTGRKFAGGMLKKRQEGKL